MIGWPPSEHILSDLLIFRRRSRPELSNCVGMCNDTGTFSVTNWREVSHVVGDDIVGGATERAMIERIIFRIRRVFPRRRFGYLFTALAEQIDESSRCITWNLDAAQDLAVLCQNILAVEPGEDFGIITPSQYELQFGRVWFRRLLAECPRRTNHDRSVNDHTPEPAAARHYFFLARLFWRYLAISCSICSSLTPCNASETLDRALVNFADQPAGLPRFFSR